MLVPFYTIRLAINRVEMLKKWGIPDIYPSAALTRVSMPRTLEVESSDLSTITNLPLALITEICSQLAASKFHNHI